MWVNNSSSVTVLTPSGRPTLHSPITAPWLQQNRTFIGGGKDIAVDSKGNAWATHSRSGTVTEITSAGSIAPHSPIRVPGFFFPWGISVDGHDNVWVINALGNLVHICGERPATCPRKDNGQPRQTGDLISPPGSNYITDSFETLTGVEIDPSGNVWVANNYKKNSAAPHPVKIPLGSNTAVILIGMAAPVKTPMIGPPRRPR